MTKRNIGMLGTAPRSRNTDRSIRSPRVTYGVTVGGSAYALLRGQLKWLSSKGWDVTLVCSPDDKAKLTVDREQVNFHGIPMRRDVSIPSDLCSLWKWISFLGKSRPDAINVGTPKAGLLGGVAAWVSRVPKRIYVVRGLRLEGAKGPFSFILWAMERISTAVATDVVVVSRSLGREMLARKLVSPKKAWLIGEGSSNGVNARAVAARASQVDRRKLRRQIGVVEQSVCVGFIGRVTKDKGIGTLIEAINSGYINEKIELVIIGPVEDTDLADEIAVLGDRVHVLPWTGDLWGVMPVLDLLCLPTRREGFPNVVLEAASAGIPTVTTRATGAVDSVIEGVTGYLVNIDDPVALAQALNKLADNPDLLRQFGKAAQERAFNDFSPEVIWCGMQAILNSEYEANMLSRLDRLGAVGVSTSL